MKLMYPAKNRLHLEKRGEKRRIAEGIKRAISAYKRSEIHKHLGVCVFCFPCFWKTTIIILGKNTAFSLVLYVDSKL
jgi:hypothetical protein